MIFLDNARVIRDQPLLKAARVALEDNRRVIRFFVDNEGNPIERTQEFFQQPQEPSGKE